MLTPADIREFPIVVSTLLARKGILGIDSVQDVYDRCVEGTAFLYICGEMEGFVILTTLFNSGNGKSDLFIWAACSLVKHSILDMYLNELEELAKKSGCATVSFRTQRAGFERALSNRWTKFTEYSLEVGNG